MLALPGIADDASALALMDYARLALERAVALPDILDVHDRAAAIQTYIKARKLGVEPENEAAEIVIRAEWKAGGELIRMAEAGERQVGGQYHHVGKNATDQLASGQLIGTTLDDLGIDSTQSSRWQRLARLHPTEESFRHLVDTARASGERLARVDFYKGRKGGGGGGWWGGKERDWTDDWRDGTKADAALANAAKLGHLRKDDLTPEQWRDFAATEDERSKLHAALRDFAQKEML
jgi:hypothetical protein